MDQCVAECKDHNSDSNILSYIFFTIFNRGRSLFKCQGGGRLTLGGHMHFHVTGRGLPLTLASQQGDHILIVPIKSLKFSSLAWFL